MVKVMNSNTLQVVREFREDPVETASFSNDNRFLFVTYKSSTSFKILDILHGNTYKEF